MTNTPNPLFELLTAVRNLLDNPMNFNVSALSLRDDVVRTLAVYDYSEEDPPYFSKPSLLPCGCPTDLPEVHQEGCSQLELAREIQESVRMLAQIAPNTLATTTRDLQSRAVKALEALIGPPSTCEADTDEAGLCVVHGTRHFTRSN
jgi:hypothetical protein